MAWGGASTFIDIRSSGGAVPANWESDAVLPDPSERSGTKQIVYGDKLFSVGCRQLLYCNCFDDKQYHSM
jgi:hypothetical protein